MRGIASYKSNNIGSSSPEQLVLTLLEGALRRQASAVEALDDQDWQRATQLLAEVREIFGELLGALDDRVAPQLTTELRRIYGWALVQTSRAATERQPAQVVEVQRVVTVLHEAWAAVAAREVA